MSLFCSRRRIFILRILLNLALSPLIPDIRQLLELRVVKDGFGKRKGSSQLTDPMSSGLAKGSSKFSSRSELSFLVRLIRLDDVEWLERDLFQPQGWFSQRNIASPHGDQKSLENPQTSLILTLRCACL